MGGVGLLAFPDEPYLCRVHEALALIWHVKDEARLLAKVAQAGVDVESEIRRSRPLAVVGDLVNTRKHGKCDDRSGLQPFLGFLSPKSSDEERPTARAGVVGLDLSASGRVEFFFQGATKDKQVVVQHADPIYRTVHVLGTPARINMGTVESLLLAALRDWVPILTTVGLLTASDRETEAIKDMLQGFASRTARPLHLPPNAA